MAWLENCLICNSGLCVEIDKLKEKGLTEFAACKKLSNESDGLYSAKQILDRYRYHTGRDRKVSEIPKEQLKNAEDEILKAADKIREKRLSHWQQEARNLGCFIENYMETNLYKFTPCRMEIKKPSTKEEWIEYLLRIMALLDSVNKRPEEVIITHNDIPCCSYSLIYPE